MRDVYYNVRGFFKNLPLFLKLAWHWRPWASEYTIDVFAKLLREQGKCMRYDGHLVLSEHYARRAFTAAGLLEKAYLDDETSHLRVVYYILKKHPPFDEKKTEKGIVVWCPVKRSNIVEGMYQIANRKHEETLVRRKKEAWEYINKYIDVFWD